MGKDFEKIKNKTKWHWKIYIVSDYKKYKKWKPKKAKLWRRDVIVANRKVDLWKEELKCPQKP